MKRKFKQWWSRIIIVVFNATFNNTSQLYRGGQFYCWRKPEYPEKYTDLPQVTDKLCGGQFLVNTQNNK
jgi:hypothetical protein